MLTFDPASPSAHRCPSGEVHTGDRVDAAWRALEHRRIAAAARDLGLVYAMTGERSHANAACDILSQYADHYGSYDGAATALPWMLKGRAFNQALTEALWAIPIVQAYDLVRPTLTSAPHSHLADQLLRPIAATLANAQQEQVRYEQGNPRSNYNAWLIAALGSLGFALDDGARVERALDAVSGFRAHLAAAILPDGFEHEGTPYYHNFVALAYTLLAEAARANRVDLYSERGPAGQSISLVWRALASLAHSDGSIPSLNDGAHHPGGPFAAEICETYEVALARTNDPVYAWLLDRHYAGRPRDAWTALVYGERDIAQAPMPQRSSVCLPSIGIAVLRDDAAAQEVCVPFGPYAGAHSHLDRLSANIFPWSTDPGTPLYGTPAREDWYRQTAAHNVVVVDGESQAQCAGRLLRWDAGPESTTLELDADAAYPGVRCSRALTLANGKLEDSLSLTSESEHTFDWLIHVDGDIQANDLKLAVGGEKLGDGAYRYLECIAEKHGLGRFEFIVQHGAVKYHMTLTADTPFAILLASSPPSASMPTQPRKTVVARVRARAVDFIATSECIR